eukprot:gnl/MRDRNA2_/MRDRNA2_149647_c0_seq1.p1 gnl/MRDRNA2_/MRDRNA2_149647_c0~~gnl/MRDRNA2_/MRDRNA2_149647_c0_seq1.p1  ORF type:complete len:513 (+),score=87.89 gnl/MRDRNA2_/MRDRNA2_149647_c0_seq1:117-1541(+)
MDDDIRKESATGSGRPASDHLLFDAKLVAQCPDLVLAHLKARRQKDLESASALIKRIGELYNTSSAKQREMEMARGRQNSLSKQFGKMRMSKDGPPDPQAEEQLMQEIQAAMADVEAAEKATLPAKAECSKLMMSLPNLLADVTPDGNDDSENPVISEWGTNERLLGSNYKTHDQIASKLGGWDIGEPAEKLSGARFAVLRGGVAALERALAAFFLDTHVHQHGYTEVSVPYIVGRKALEGTGQLPKFEDDLFKISHPIHNDTAFLIPTAEVPVTNLYSDMIIAENELPVKMCCLSPCFRPESGRHGDETRGLMRQHQFQKVELVKIVKAEESPEEHEALTGNAEAVLQALKLPYRKVRLCSGDIGFSASHCYDLEVWLPGQQAYREISSCSNFGDFQARRMGLRYRPAPTKQQQHQKAVYPHTLNGSGLAVGRALVAVLENYQQPDGSVTVPEVLRPYMLRYGEALQPAEKRK